MRALPCEEESKRCYGAPEGTRTPNRLIRSQVLYPLSYRRVASQERLVS